MKNDQKTKAEAIYPPGYGAVDKLRETGEDGSDESGDSSGQMDARSNGRFFEAEEYIRTSSRANAEYFDADEGESDRQSRRLHEWAKKAGCIIVPSDFERYDKLSEQTSEHVVYFDETSNRVVKHTLSGQFGWVPKLEHGRWSLGIALPLDYLVRWRLFNDVFGDDVRLEGVTVISGASMILGGGTDSIAVVISQRWHSAMDPTHAEPTEEEIAGYMRRAGFEELPNSFYGWCRLTDDLIVLDARPDNFVKTKIEILPVDLLVTQTKGDAP